MTIFPERVFHHCGEGLLFRADRNYLAADWIVRIFWINEADEVRGDVNAELPFGGEPLFLIVG